MHLPFITVATSREQPDFNHGIKQIYVWGCVSLFYCIVNTDLFCFKVLSNSDKTSVNVITVNRNSPFEVFS